MAEQLTIVSLDDGVALVGEVDMETAPQVADALASLGERRSTVVVDMARVVFIDSAGLRLLITATSRARETGGDLIVADPSTMVRRLIRIAGLDGHLTVRSGGDTGS